MPPSHARIAEDVVSLSLPLPFGPRQVNCFLIDDAGGVTLVDTGVDTPETAAAFDAAMADLGIRPAAIRRILLTHYHADHSGRTARLRGRREVEIAVHEADAPLLANFSDGSETSLAALLVLLETLGMPPEDLGDVSAGVRSLRGLARPAPATRRLAGYERVRIGSRTFEVLPTPGHTPGHVGLLERATGLLLAGDVLAERAMPYVGLSPVSDPDPIRTLLRSLEALAASGAVLGLPGHGGCIPDAPGRAAETADAIRRDCDRVRGALSDEPCTAYALLAGLAPEARRPFHRHVALLALGARLAHLVAEGRAEVDRDGRRELYRIARRG